MALSETCMFCLEDIKSQEVSLNPIGCHCAYKAHTTCLTEWFEQKNQYECPICHAVSVPNPVHNPIQIVVVRERSNFLNEVDPGTQKCMGWCCITLIVWSIFANVLDLFLRS